MSTTAGFIVPRYWIEHVAVQLVKAANKAYEPSVNGTFLCPMNRTAESSLQQGTAGLGTSFSYIAGTSTMGDFTNADSNLWVRPVKRNHVKPDKIVVAENGTGIMLSGAVFQTPMRHVFNWHKKSAANYLLNDGSVQTISDPAFDAPCGGAAGPNPRPYAGTAADDVSTSTRAMWYRVSDRPSAK